MQGTIVKVVAEAGQQVDEGETIMVMEAMKMEQPLTAHRPGVVASISVAEGEAVSPGSVVAEITATD